jgi:Uri superfamily endonuclease
MSIKVKIYSILCPISKEVKYVGKTFGTLKDRLSRHVSNSKDKSKKKIWIIENVKNNMFPEIILIDEVDSVLSNVTEKKWILYYGIDNLLNENKGGGGCSIK